MQDLSLPIARYAPPAAGDVRRDARDEHASAAAVQAEVLSLFDTAAPGLRRYVRSCGLPTDAAEDVVQEAFLALFRHLAAGGARHNLRGWLVQVSYRLALRQREHRARILRRESPWASAGADAVADPTDDPEAQLAARERRGRLQAVYCALPERERQCIALRAEGVRYREIARILGISLGTVAKSLTYAITRLSNSVKG